MVLTKIQYSLDLVLQFNTIDIRLNYLYAISKFIMFEIRLDLFSHQSDNLSLINVILLISNLNRLRFILFESVSILMKIPCTSISKYVDLNILVLGCYLLRNPQLVTAQVMD